MSIKKLYFKYTFSFKEFLKIKQPGILNYFFATEI